MRMTEENKMVRRTRRSSRISTIVSISLVLFLLGMLGVLLLHANRLGDYVKENIEVSFTLKAEADSVLLTDLLQQLGRSPVVKSAQLVSADSAAARLKAELGEDFISFLGYNPLSAAVDVRLEADYASADQVSGFTEIFRRHPAVREVYYQPSLIESVNRNLRSITWIVLVFSALLLIVSVALINNTIRISLYANRLLIKSMLLVGANRSFIRRPFLWNSLLNGVLGAFVALLLLGAVSYWAWQRIPELNLIRDTRLMAMVGASIIGFGVLLSLICTFVALNKYLRYRTIDLN